MIQCESMEHETPHTTPSQGSHAHERHDGPAKSASAPRERQRLEMPVPEGADAAIIAGEADANLNELGDAFDALVTLRGDRIIVEGDPTDVHALSFILDDLIIQAGEGSYPDVDYVRHAIALRRREEFLPQELREDVILTCRGNAIRPKTPGQKRYVDAIRANTITFGIGPAGTGKTYLAMAMAIAALEMREVGRIVLSRPILEAGENLGFLPGTLTEKVDPYIRPLYDALFDMMDHERATMLLETGTIEVAPLAFMRGRTLNDSFVILDEAQNTTHEQMKMFLTRLGFGSKMVVTGDLSQSDLPQKSSGLLQATGVLQDVPGIAFCAFKGTDVVRNSLVSDIIAAYERQGL